MASVVQVHGEPNPMLTVDQIAQGLQNIQRTNAQTQAVQQNTQQSAQLQPSRLQLAQTQAQDLPGLDQARIQHFQMQSRSGGMAGLAGQYNYLNYLSETYGPNDPRTLQLKQALDTEINRKKAQTAYYGSSQRFLGPQERIQLDQEFHNAPDKYSTGLQVALQKQGWTQPLLAKYGFSPSHPPPLNQSMQSVISGMQPPGQSQGVPLPTQAGAAQPVQSGGQVPVQAPGAPSSVPSVIPASQQGVPVNTGGALGGQSPAQTSQVTPTTQAPDTVSSPDELQQAAETLQIASTVDKDNYTTAQLGQIRRYNGVITNFSEMNPLVSDAANYAGMGGKLSEISEKELGRFGIKKGTPQYNNLLTFKKLQTTIANELMSATLSPKTDTALKEWLDVVKSPGATTAPEVIQQYNNLQNIVAAQAHVAGKPIHEQIKDVQSFKPNLVPLPQSDNNVGGALGASASGAVTMPSFSNKADAVKWYNALSPEQQSSLKG